MSRVTKIFGPPGTGKTTRLLDLVAEAMAAGVRPERIAYMAFTKKAAREAVARAMERFKMGQERFPWFRTLHSLAYEHCHAHRDDIMKLQHFQELGKTLGFQFTSLDDETTMMANGTALGDRVSRIESLARVKKITLQDEWYENNQRDVEWLAVKQWADGLRIYKDSRGMLDFTDLLEQYDGALDVDLFIVDEAQDLSNAQWEVVKSASANAKKVYLAGDDDQCIYGWAGANVDRFRLMKGLIEIRPVSFRLPRRIHKLAQRIVSDIRVRQAKEWRPRDEDGMVNRNINEHTLDFSKGKWMLIARNHSQLRRFEEVLHNQGYVYSREGKHSTDNAVSRAILSWERWRRGNPIDVQDVKVIQSLLPALECWHPTEDVYLDDAPLPAELKSKNWMEALEVQPRQREYIRACLSNREQLDGEPRILVSTIHQVKGGEADNVVLIPDISVKPWEQRHTDEEQRVLYVAVTRAKQTLTICQPETQRCYSI